MKHILVVDDDPEFATFIMDVLASLRYEVTHASNGLEAVQCALKRRIDLIVMDICMPYLSGLWFCNAFREKHETRNIPIIIVSGMADDESRRRAAELGAQAFIRKPFHTSELLDAVKKLAA